MEKENKQTNEDEEFLESLFRDTEYICSNCLLSVDADDDQTHTYCDFCESYTEIMKRDKS